MESFIDGSNVVLSVTNYISGAYSTDHAKLSIKELRPGETNYVEIYNSCDEIILHTAALSNSLDRIIRNKVAEVLLQINEKADKAWGRHSSTGGDVPISNTVWITEQNLRIAGGMEYERVAVGEGSIYVLAAKGQAPYMQGDEGAILIHDDGGTNYFGMARSDSYTIGCNTSGISTDAGNLVTLSFAVTMSNHPCVWYTPTLEGNPVWEQLNTPDGAPIPGATVVVTWDESPRLGAQECYINCEDWRPCGFFRATVEVAGDARFKTNMASELGGGIYCTDGRHRVKIDYNNGTPRLVVAQ